MTDAQKLAKLKTQLNISDTSLDTKLNDYLDTAKLEIIAWLYHNRKTIPSNAELPMQYDLVQIEAALTQYILEGGENESAHSENGVSRTFRYPSMAELIQARVVPLIGGLG